MDHLSVSINRCEVMKISHKYNFSYAILKMFYRYKEHIFLQHFVMLHALYRCMTIGRLNKSILMLKQQKYIKINVLYSESDEGYSIQ